MSPNVVSGTISTVTELGKDEAWLYDWLKEQPTRLGLGELSAIEDDGAEAEAGGTRSFVATSEDRHFSVDVQLGELDATHGFGMLDGWARSRARNPEKEHVAVLVTETTGERYRTTLEALSQHLPLVVVELQAWRGENEALVVPHVALASPSVDLGSAPALAAARAITALKAAAEATVSNAASPAPGKATDAKADAKGAKADEADEADEPAAEAKADAEVEAEGADDSVDKDDTGVRDPWGLPRPEPEPAASTSNGSRLLSRFNT